MVNIDNNSFSFSIMNKDEEASRVRVNGNKVEVEILNPNPLLNYVSSMPLDRFHLMERLELRCFPRNRVSAKKILEHMELQDYNILEIIKRTHGVKADDFAWIKFEGENLSFADVSRRMEDVCQKDSEIEYD